MRKLILYSKQAWKLLILVFLVVLAFSYAMFQGGFVSWFLFYSFAPFALYALLLSFYQMKQIKLQREFSKSEFHAGEALTVTITLDRVHAFPLGYLVIEDVLPEELTTTVNTKRLLFPWFQRQLQIAYEIPALPRGEHDFIQIRLRFGDLLGLVEKERLYNLQNKVLVYPHIEEMLFRPFENRFDQGMTASRERVQRDTTMAVGIREYQPGDKFSWINWKASAKRNELMTKEFEQRQSHDIFVFMDCVRDERFEVTVSFVASIFQAMIKKGVQVGLFAMSHERKVFPIRGGDEQLQSVLYHLAKIRAESAVMFDQVLALERQLIHQNVSFVLVTAQLSRELIEKAAFVSASKGTVTIFLMKQAREVLSSHEVAWKQLAMARGISVIPVHEGGFDEVFAEVSRR